MPFYNLYINFPGGLIPRSHVDGLIEFRNIDFNYPTREEAMILSGLNLTMPAGTVTAVVGSSGSGKSTLGSLLLRFYDPNSGGYLVFSDITIGTLKCLVYFQHVYVYVVSIKCLKQIIM